MPVQIGETERQWRDRKRNKLSRTHMIREFVQEYIDGSTLEKLH